jgi:hypothetical protein
MTQFLAMLPYLMKTIICLFTTTVVMADAPGKKREGGSKRKSNFDEVNRKRAAIAAAYTAATTTADTAASGNAPTAVAEPHRNAWMQEAAAAAAAAAARIEEQDRQLAEQELEIKRLKEELARRDAEKIAWPLPFQRGARNQSDPKPFKHAEDPTRERRAYFTQRGETHKKIIKNMTLLFALLFAGGMAFVDAPGSQQQMQAPNVGIPFGYQISGVDLRSPRGEHFRLDGFHDNTTGPGPTFKPGHSPISTRMLNARGFVDPPTSTDTTAVFRDVRGNRPSFFSATASLDNMPEFQRRRMLAWIGCAAAWKVSNMHSDLSYYSLARWTAAVPPMWRIQDHLERMDIQNADTFDIRTTTTHAADGTRQVGYTRGTERTIRWFLENRSPTSMSTADATPATPTAPGMSPPPLPPCPVVTIRVGADGRQVFGNGNTGSFHQSICCLKVLPPYGPCGSSPNDELLVGVHDGPEGYAMIEAHFSRIFEEIEGLHGAEIELNNGTRVQLRFVLCSDYKYLLELLGLQPAMSEEGWCIFCQCTKDNINKVSSLCVNGVNDDDSVCSCGFKKWKRPAKDKDKRTKVEKAADRKPVCVVSRPRSRADFDLLPDATLRERGWVRRPLLYDIAAIPDTLHLIMRITVSQFYYWVMGDAVERNRTQQVEAEMHRIGISNWRFTEGGDPEDATTGTAAAASTTGTRVRVPNLNGDPARTFLAEFDLSVVYDGPPGVTPYHLPTRASLAQHGSSDLDNMNILFHMFAGIINTLEATSDTDYGAIPIADFIRRLHMFGNFFLSLIAPGRRMPPYMHVLILHLPRIMQEHGYLHGMGMEGLEALNRIMNRLFRRSSAFNGGKGGELSHFSKRVICHAMRMDIMRADIDTRNVFNTRPWRRRVGTAEDSEGKENDRALAAWTSENSGRSPNWVWDLGEALPSTTAAPPEAGAGGTTNLAARIAAARRAILDNDQMEADTAAYRNEVEEFQRASEHAEEAEALHNAESMMREEVDREMEEEKKQLDAEAEQRDFDASLDWESAKTKVKKEKTAATTTTGLREPATPTATSTPQPPTIPLAFSRPVAPNVAHHRLQRTLRRFFRQGRERTCKKDGGSYMSN